ncbi:MAG: sulfatase activating formylglycine-generating enzyme [Bacteroidia bacterium]
MVGFTPKIIKVVFQKQPKGMVYIPTGTYNSESGVKTNITPIWMQEKEVTNEQYLEYLNELRDSSLTDSFLKAYPDTSLINKEFCISDYFNYFENELFQDFPVVGLTLNQINGYALWLTAKLRLENPEFSMDCRLPSVAEWKYASAGGRSLNNYANNSSSTTNSLGDHLFHFFYGDFRYEFYRNIYGCQLDYYDHFGSTYDYAYERYYLKVSTKNLKKVKTKNLVNHTMRRGFPTRAKSFFPNDYGLYNTAGNVAELVMYDEKNTIAVGGSYKTGPEYCRIHYEKLYPFDHTSPQVDLGFRLVCNYEKKFKY